MQVTVTQTPPTVKPIIIRDVVAFRLGVEDGRNGCSEWEGYAYYSGAKYAEWRKGWLLGKRTAQRKALQAAAIMPDDFAGALEDVAVNGIRYATPAAYEHDQYGRLADEPGYAESLPF